MKKDEKLAAADIVANAFLLNKLFCIGQDENGTCFVSAFADGATFDDVMPNVALQISEDYIDSELEECNNFCFQLYQAVASIVFQNETLRCAFESYYLRVLSEITTDECVNSKILNKAVPTFIKESNANGLLKLISCQSKSVQLSIYKSLDEQFTTLKKSK